MWLFIIILIPFIFEFVDLILFTYLEFLRVGDSTAVAD